MPCYKELDLDNYGDSVKEFLPKIEQLIGSSNEFYNDLDLDWFMSNCPEQLLKQITNIGGKVTLPFVLKVSDSNYHKFNSNGIHVDGGIVDYRLNLPLLNSDSIETRFYQIKDANIPDPRVVNTYGSVANFYKEADLELIDRLVITRPVIFPVKIPHGLFVIKQQFPRYVLTIQFESDAKLRHHLT